MAQELIDQLSKKYPFLTLCLYAGDEYIGIVQNQDDTVTTIYDFGQLKDLPSKELFITLANIWWWESNRSIPINIFLKQEWEPFRSCLKTFSNKDLEIISGPVCSLRQIVKRKSKKKSVTLVRKVIL
jgi:hypothetical protein